MELITSRDIYLRGTDWDKAVGAFSEIFSSRPYYNLFLLSASIGIMYDKRIDKPAENGEDFKTLPRNVIDNQERIDHRFDVMAQTAILHTQTENWTDDERIKKAFDDQDGSVNALDFLLEFANFGVTKLVEQIGVTTTDTMDKLKDFLASCVEGSNYDIYGISEDELIEHIGDKDVSV